MIWKHSSISQRLLFILTIAEVS